MDKVEREKLEWMTDVPQHPELSKVSHQLEGCATDIMVLNYLVYLYCSSCIVYATSYHAQRTT